MAARGWLRLYRSVWHDHPVLDGDTFSRREAWLFLCANAAYEPYQRPAGAMTITLDRGEFVASVRKLADRWKWGKSKVSQFLSQLQKSDMIADRYRTPAGTVYVIVNYDAYQGGHVEAADTFRPEARTETRTHKENTTISLLPLREDEAGEDWNGDGDAGAWARSRMWSEFNARADAANLADMERRKAEATVRGIITGDTRTAWSTHTGDLVPWHDRPRLFRLALDERSANGGKLHVVLRQVIIPREYDPFEQRRSTDPKPQTEHAAVRADQRNETPGRSRTAYRQDTPDAAPQPVSIEERRAREARDAAAASERREREDAEIQHWETEHELDARRLRATVKAEFDAGPMARLGTRPKMEAEVYRNRALEHIHLNESAA